MTQIPKNIIINGDCIEEMKKLPENSVDAIVTDPPYALAFMNKSWDKFKPKEFQEFSFKWGKEALRVLKPGGHLLAFCGTRTYHRMVIGLEDAGFEIRDMIEWFYGEGMPKSLNIGKQIDKIQGNEREVVGNKKTHDIRGNALMEATIPEYKKEVSYIQINITKGNSEWEGWGTSLKPSHEPIVVARKPLSERNVALNVLKWGTGGINIDGCRIPIRDLTPEQIKRKYTGSNEGNNSPTENFGIKEIKMVDDSPFRGRFPANLILDKETAKMLDEQSGTIKTKLPFKKIKESKRGMFGAGEDASGQKFTSQKGLGIKLSGASRFFYCPKVSKSERNAGLEEIKNNIVTLKPINLMRYLVRLVTPKNGIVLDPFAGSGTTGCACVIEGFNYILIEKRERFAKIIAPKRIEYWSKPKNWEELSEHKELPNPKERAIIETHKSLNKFINSDKL